MNAAARPDVSPGMTTLSFAPTKRRPTRVATGLPSPVRTGTVSANRAVTTRSRRLSDEEAGFDVRRAVRAHGPELFGFALNACGDRALADDCVQETFVRAWQSRRRFDPERGSMRTWLFAIARNVVIDELRSRARRPVADAESRLEHRQDPVADHDRMVAHVTLVWALAQLSEAHRRVVVAVRLEGVGYEELSRRDGVPVATLRTRMYHALRRLREILGEEA